MLVGPAYGLGFRVRGHKLKGLGARAYKLEFRISGRVYALGSRTSTAGFKARAHALRQQS